MKNHFYRAERAVPDPAPVNPTEISEYLRGPILQ